VAAGDLDGDGKDDLIGVWSSGLWVMSSLSGNWAKISVSLPVSIASGDMNGDGMDDVMGTWSPGGTYYRDTLGGNWVYVSTPADSLAAGDLDGDGIDDLIGVWSNGLWVKYSSSQIWGMLDKHPPSDIAAGDLNGDGRDDVLGTWSTYGTYYKDTLSGNWVYISTPADLVAAGDLDADGVDDLIGIWGGVYCGLWVRYSEIIGWKKICMALPVDIDAGLFRGGAWDVNALGYLEPVGGFAEGPGNLSEYEDLSDEGPGGWNFVYQEQSNLTPQETYANIMRTPGPGEPGFRCTQQENPVPTEPLEPKKKKRD
jgi:hypothetical protein